MKNMANTAAVMAAQQLIKAISPDYRIPRDILRRVILGHPDFPALTAAQEALTALGFHCCASTSAFPALTALKSGEWAMIKEKKGEDIVMLTPLGIKRRISSREFENERDPSAPMLTGSAPPSDAPTRRFNSTKRGFAGFPSGILIMIILPLIALTSFLLLRNAGSGLNSMLIGLGLVKMMGVLLCALLAFGEMKTNQNPLISCASGGWSDCGGVAASPAGRFMGIPMSDIGMIYFLGGLLALWLALPGGEAAKVLLPLSLLNLLTLPYSIFSVFYQGIVLRAWCRICLLVQALFWIEFNLLADFLAKNLKKGLNDMSVYTLLGFVLGATVWRGIKHIRGLRGQNDVLIMANQQQRSDPRYIAALLASTPSAVMEDFPGEPFIGDKNAPFHVVLLINPLCPPCGDSLRELNTLMAMRLGGIRATLRFQTENPGRSTLSPSRTGQTSGSSFPDAGVAAHLTALGLENHREIAWKAILSWFSQPSSLSWRSFEKWRRRHRLGKDSTLRQGEGIISGHREWLEKNNLQVTPLFWVNGIRLPSGFSPLDMWLYFLRKSAGPGATGGPNVV